MSSELQRIEMRPMDFGEILDTAIRVLRIGWKPLFATGLIGAIPSVIYSGVSLSLFPAPATMDNPMSNWFFRAAMRADAGDYSNLFQMGGVLFFLMLFMLLFGVWMNGALIVLASRLYLGLPVTMGMALRIAGRRYFALLGTGLLKLLFFILAVPAGVLGGLVIFFFITVPAAFAILGVYSAFASHALLVENHGGGWAPIRRSMALVSGRFWPLLGLGIVFYLFAAVLNGQLAAITQMPAQLAMTFTKDPDLLPILTWVTAICTGLLAAFTAPLNYVGVTLAYYDTRMRKEGLDLEIMAAGPKS